MSSSQAFTVELGGCVVSCRLDLPPENPKQKTVPAAMICPGLPGPGQELAQLHEQVTAALVEGGVAVATLAAGSAGAPGSRLAVEAIDDAAALFHGLAVCEKLDLERIGIFGHSLGAIIAACLSRRSDQVKRLALLSPVTVQEVKSRLAAEPEGSVAAALGGGPVPPGFFDGLEFLNPVEDAARHDRPTLILHGAADRLVAPEHSSAYCDAIAGAGHQVDHVLVAQGDHFFTDLGARSACLNLLCRFFSAPNGAARW